MAVIPIISTSTGLAWKWPRRWPSIGTSASGKWGIAGQDATEIKKLFAQGYQGSRYSPGYPACPNLEDQTQIFALLQPERIGLELTENSCWSRSSPPLR